MYICASERFKGQELILEQTVKSMALDISYLYFPYFTFIPLIQLHTLIR